MHTHKLIFVLLPQVIATLNNYTCSLPPLANVHWRVLFVNHVDSRDKSILLSLSPIFVFGNSFFLPIMLKILLEVSIFYSKLSYHRITRIFGSLVKCIMIAKNNVCHLDSKHEFLS